MMDFLLTSVLMFGTGVLVGRLFYKLNPFFMLLGIILGGAMFVFALERNGLYAVVMIFGFFYGIAIMRSRHSGIETMGDGSLLGKISDFLYFNFELRKAKKFREAEVEEDNAYDEYKQYEQQSRKDSQQAQNEAQGRTEKARRDSESAKQKQEDINKQWYQFQKEKEKYEQEKSQDNFVDTRTSYQILEVDENASLKEIKKAYQKLSFKFHPDRNHNKPPNLIREAEKECIKVRHAYEALTGKKAKR